MTECRTFEKEGKSLFLREIVKCMGKQKPKRKNERVRKIGTEK